VSWLDWSGTASELVGVVGRLVRLRRSHPVFRQRAFFEGHRLDDGVKDVAWFTPDGEEMSDADWSSPSARTIGMYLSGRGIRTRGPRGEAIVDDSFLFVLHAGGDDQPFRLPGTPWASAYAVEVDTTAPLVGAAPAEGGTLAGGSSVILRARSALLLRSV